MTSPLACVFFFAGKKLNKYQTAIEDLRKYTFPNKISKLNYKKKQKKSTNNGQKNEFIYSKHEKYQLKYKTFAEMFVEHFFSAT